MIKKIALCISVLPVLAQADIADKMDSFFDNTTIANFTSPAAVNSQEADYLSGGNANIKANVSNMQLARIQVPSFNSGCGGIDLYAGGFAFINAKQLITFGKNILANAAPVAVDLALQTWAPSIASVKNKFQAYAEDINNFNMSSCQAAEIGVSAIQDAVSGQKTMEHTCKALNAQNNEFSGWLAARENCSTDAQIEEAAEKAKKQHKNYSVIAPNRNIAWYVLNHPNMIDSDVAQYIISLVGTVSYGKDPSLYQEYPGLFRTIDSPIIQSFMEGGDVVEYKCDSTSMADDSCLNMTKIKRTIPVEKSMVAKVDSVLKAIVAGISSGQDLTEKQKEMIAAFGNIPVIADFRNSLALNRVIDTHLYAKYLASKIVENYVDNLMDQLSSSIASNQPGQKVIQNMQNQARRVSQALAQQSSDAKKAIDAESAYYTAQAEKQKEVDNANTSQAKR